MRTVFSFPFLFLFFLIAGCSLFRLAHLNYYDPLYTGVRTNEVFLLTASYPFSGNANDASGFGHDGEVSNAILSNDRFGVINSAYYFDGATSLIYFNNRLSTNSRFTLMFWLKDDSTTQDYRRWITTTPGSIVTSSIMIRELNTGNGGGAQLYNGSSWASSTNYTNSMDFWKDGNWHMFAVTADGSSSRVYYDGTFIFAVHNAVIPELGIYAGGFYSLGGNEYFLGFMDDIRIFNGPLTQSEILDYFHENGW